MGMPLPSLQFDPGTRRPRYATDMNARLLLELREEEMEQEKKLQQSGKLSLSAFKDDHHAAEMGGASLTSAALSLQEHLHEQHHLQKHSVLRSTSRYSSNASTSRS